MLLCPSAMVSRLHWESVLLTHITGNMTQHLRRSAGACLAPREFRTCFLQPLASQQLCRWRGKRSGVEDPTGSTMQSGKKVSVCPVTSVHAPLVVTWAHSYTQQQGELRCVVCTWDLEYRALSPLYTESQSWLVCEVHMLVCVCALCFCSAHNFSIIPPEGKGP